MSETTPVLIVGAGPVGLAVALDLGLRGTRSIVVERGSAEGDVLPAKAGTLNERTMELCRMWGIAEQVAHWGADDTYPRDTVYVTQLTGGHFVGRSPAPSAHDRVPPAGTREILRKCPQHILDPILQKAALATGQVEIRYETSVVSFAEGDRGVTVTLRGADGTEGDIVADYLVGCDGAGSTVRRGLGIPFEGKTLDHSVSIVVKVDRLEKYHDYGRAERFLFLGPEGTIGNATSMDYQDHWRFGLLGLAGRIDVDAYDADQAVRSVMGTDDIPYEIAGVVPWRRSQCAAASFRSGRVVLAGDSAHTTSPTGGHGLNTGLGDAATLGWMLDAMVKGWGREGLLAAYTGERRPVAIRNSTSSTNNYGNWTSSNDTSQVLVEGPEGDAARAEIGARLEEALSEEWHSIGIALGYRYDDSPIVIPDGTEPTPDEVSTYVPTARPGHRAPHVELADGSSTLDLFGRSFVLLVLGADDDRAGHLAAAASDLGVPLDTTRLEEASVREAYDADLVLVRPDGHVAWRSSAPVSYELAWWILSTVSGHQSVL
ncbi:MAG: hypothetical protein JWP31_2591 [Aeromicrobium sp.]|nr:hypothetical protein [Aeromicrobium sp.]